MIAYPIPWATVPALWRTTVTIHDSAGRDDDGNVTPGASRTIAGAVVTPGGSSESEDPSDLSSDAATLYLPPGHALASTARVEAPAHSAAPGVWSIDGTPSSWPWGTVAKLTRN